MEGFFGAKLKNLINLNFPKKKINFNNKKMRKIGNIKTYLFLLKNAKIIIFDDF